MNWLSALKAAGDRAKRAEAERDEALVLLSSLGPAHNHLEDGDVQYVYAGLLRRVEAFLARCAVLEGTTDAD